MLYSSQVDGTLGTAQVFFLLSGGFLKMVVPNNHWFSLLKNGAFWDVKWGYIPPFKGNTHLKTLLMSWSDPCQTSSFSFAAESPLDEMCFLF